MNKKNLWIAVFALLLSGTFASAQERQIKEEGRTEFKRHWFMQVQVGAAHTVGEAKFTDLISPAAISLLPHGVPVWVSADGRQKVVGSLPDKTTNINICRAM